MALWSDFALIPCADGKARRVKSGSFPLVAGLPAGMGRRRDPGAPIDTENSAEARVMRLRGYGNAIVPQVAARFIRAAMEAM
jgi:DNA (cytosine-5)-methyltransferase 1